ncbi:MAG: hypothetical protein GTO51_05475 [Candidatus Latescibacteria bacterium]|nr:hypothetical protein [Candidatus Latescibacterota bacterium]NIO28454.1 hypothetical protein [Candidatus Latescibacterota bacterium]NIO56003.1 hypothetical protein [Candidatus Latescibacterota bacterium]NIT01967.1 hypothetical protein [Candidatus Latescibacterota bacterium]
MKWWRCVCIGVIFATVSFPLVLTDVNAVPAFSRRYKISCSTCHAPFPKLNPYGDEFAGNGFIIPEEEKERDYVSGGDNLLWLNRHFPIAVRFDAFAVYEENKTVENDLQTPWGLKLLSGGTLFKNIGYYFYFYLSERGEVEGIEDAYIHFDNIVKTSLDIMVGQFQTSDPLMKRELRLTFEDYEIYRTRIGESETNLAYDRGVMFVYGIDQTGTDLIAAVVNGNGKEEAGDDRKFDNDKYKNGLLRISQAVGDVLSIGGYAYYGKEALGSRKNEIIYFGPDLNISIGPIEITGQYLLRKDTNPTFVQNPSDIETHGIVGEIILAPQLDRSRYYFTALYNRIDSDLNAFDYETATMSTTYLVARNLRLLAEFTYNLEDELSRVVVGLLSAF